MTTVPTRARPMHDSAPAARPVTDVETTVAGDAPPER